MNRKITATVCGEKISTVFTDNSRDSAAHRDMLRMLYGNAVTIDVEKVKTEKK